MRLNCILQDLFRDSFETVCRILKSIGKIRTVLGRPESYETIRKDPDSFATVWKILKSTGKIQAVLNRPESFEHIQKDSDSLKPSGRFFSQPERGNTFKKVLP